MCWRDVICVTTEYSNILTKKKIFDAYMSKVRLQEEKVILMREMRQHCTYLRRLAGNIRRMMSDMSSGRDGGKKLTPGTILLILVTPWPNSIEILACLSFTFPSRQLKWRGASWATVSSPEKACWCGGQVPSRKKKLQPGFRTKCCFSAGGFAGGDTGGA